MNKSCLCTRFPAQWIMKGLLPFFFFFFWGGGGGGGGGGDGEGAEVKMDLFA